MLAGGEKRLVEIMAATHTGKTTAEFEKIVNAWIATAKHPTTEPAVHRDACTSRCSSAGLPARQRLQDLHRLGRRGRVHPAVGGRVYGIPPEQVVGSRGKTRFEMRDGSPVLGKLPEIDLVDDGGQAGGHPAGIGRRPTSRSATPTATSRCSVDDDRARARLGVLVHHTDAQREWANDPASHIGLLTRGLDEADASRLGRRGHETGLGADLLAFEG